MKSRIPFRNYLRPSPPLLVALVLLLFSAQAHADSYGLGLDVSYGSGTLVFEDSVTHENKRQAVRAETISLFCSKSNDGASELFSQMIFNWGLEATFLNNAKDTKYEGTGLFFSGNLAKDLVKRSGFTVWMGPEGRAAICGGEFKEQNQKDSAEMSAVMLGLGWVLGWDRNPKKVGGTSLQVGVRDSWFWETSSERDVGSYMTANTLTFFFKIVSTSPAGW